MPPLSSSDLKGNTTMDQRRVPPMEVYGALTLLPHELTEEIFTYLGLADTHNVHLAVSSRMRITDSIDRTRTITNLKIWNFHSLVHTTKNSSIQNEVRMRMRPIRRRRWADNKRRRQKRRRLAEAEPGGKANPLDLTMA